MKKWYEEQPKENDVVISSRVRLARNVKGILFSQKLTEEAAKSLVDQVLAYTKDLSSLSGNVYYDCRVNQLRDLDKMSLMERHMMSTALASKEQPTGLVISQDDHISIMVNEEDHIRIQSVYRGMNLEQAYADVNHLDDYYNERLNFAFDEHYGYLTSCPTNVGTGMKASYLLFLPALGMTGKIDQLAEESAKYGVSIKPIVQDPNKVNGYLYEMSNKSTLGQSESEIMDNLKQIANQAVSQERRRREYLITVNGEEIEDKVYRSYGVLRYAKKMTTQDAMLMLSQLKFGYDAGVIDWEQEFNIYQLMVEISPANLQKIAGKSMNKNERDRFRASYIRSRLADIKNEKR